MTTNFIIVLLALIILLILISFIIYGQQKNNVNTLKSYFFEKASLGPFQLALTLSASYLAASSFIAGPGAAHKQGLSWVIISLTQVPILWLSLGILGSKLSTFAQKYDATTLNDFFFIRYGSSFLLKILSIGMLICYFFMSAVQFICMARVLEVLLGLSFLKGLFIFATIVVLYTMFGGFRASVITDVIQGMIIFIASILLLATLLHNIGGISKAMEALKNIDPALLSPTGPNNYLDMPLLLSFWVLVGFGVIGLPVTAARIMAAKNNDAIYKGALWGTFFIFVTMLILPLTGVISRVLLPSTIINDQVIPLLIVNYLPPLIAAFLFIAVLCASMSTVDSIMLQAGSTILKDLCPKVWQKLITATTPKNAKLIAMAIASLLGMITMFVAAWSPPETIVWFSLKTLGGLEVLFLWPLVLGLYWPKANSSGAISSSLIGIISYIFFIQFDDALHALIGNWMPVVPSLLLGLFAFIIGNYFPYNKQHNLANMDQKWLHIEDA